MELSDFNFNILRDFIYTISSISLADSKKYLVKQRLTPLIQDLKMSGFDELVHIMSTSPDQNLIDMVISAMTTNESFFFRDGHIFESIKKHIIPKLVEKMKKRFRITIWSSACSTGQEPYTIAMLLDEYLQNNSEVSLNNVEIIATDIDPVVLKKSKKGSYTNLEISRGLPQKYKQKYFTLKDNIWYIDEKLKKVIKFKRMNLMGNDSYPINVDFILCRNVLIYFDDDVKLDIINNMYKANREDGIFLLGSSESLFNMNVKYKKDIIDNLIIYRKN